LPHESVIDLPSSGSSIAASTGGSAAAPMPACAPAETTTL